MPRGSFNLVHSGSLCAATHAIGRMITLSVRPNMPTVNSSTMKGATLALELNADLDDGWTGTKNVN